MKEFELIASLKKILGQTFDPGIVLGPGDDAAYLHPSLFSGKGLLVSSDMLVEGVHFRTDWSEYRDIAWKALAVNESDIAAMGGEPAGFLISLGVPDLSEYIPVHELYHGFKEYLMERKLAVFGGDIVRNPVLAISVSVLGCADVPVRRSGARVGDTVYLSREIGWAGMGLRVLEGAIDAPEDVKTRALLAHRRPVPETELGRVLSAKGGLTSMIDVSDGLLQDALHLCESGNVNFLLFEDQLPLCDFFGLSRERFFSGLVSGDDYALLFTSALAPDEMSKITLPSRVFPIGRVIPVQDGEKIYFTTLSEVDSGIREPLTDFLVRNKMDPKKIGYTH
jgi:thiamine-monophosphate kinase